MIVKHSPSEFYHPKILETLDAETETGRAFYFQKPSTGALGRCATVGPHCHDLEPIFHTKIPNNVNFIFTELSGAHCKHPKQVQEQSER